MTPNLRASRASIAARAIAVLAAAAFLAAGVASATGRELPGGDDEQGRVVRVTEGPARKAEIRRLIQERDARETPRAAPEPSRSPAPRTDGERDRGEGAEAPEGAEPPEAPEASQPQPETIPEGEGGASGGEGDG
jgi:hypothetical protein